MSQRRSYPNSGDFNLDDLFRPEPGQSPQQQQQPPQAPPAQPPYPQQPQPPYGGVPDQAAATQYLPPYPTADPGGPQPGPMQPGPVHQAPVHPQAPGQVYQSFPEYPEPQEYQGHQGYQGIEDYPTARVPAQQPAPGPGPGPVPVAPPAPPAGPAPTAGPSRGGRSSNKLVIGGVVAGCAAGALLVAFLMSGEDGKPGKAKHTPAAPAASGPATGAASATPSGPAALSADGKAQAQAMSALLATANDSRQAVVNAVAAVQRCEKLPESQQALTAAAGQRKDLQGKLAGLKTDQLPNGAQLVEQLNQAWQASATADEEYAAWAGDSQAPGACDPKKVDNQHYRNAGVASGNATTAKKQASLLWNAVAGQAGLPTRGAGEL